jgi:serine/threonine protein kinase
MYVFNSTYNNELTIYRRIMGQRPQIPENVSQELRSLITRLLNKDPYDRIKIEEIKAHLFFNVSSFPYVILNNVYKSFSSKLYLFCVTY